MELMDRIAKRASSIQIVDYEPKYLEGTVRVAVEIHAHSIYRNMPLDVEKVIDQLALAGNVAPDRFFKLAVRGDEVLGGFFGCTLRVFFCDQLTAKDMGWWVKESSRGGAAAILLLQAFENWARSRGARKSMVGQSGVENIERTTRLYVHCGYLVTGFNTCKEL